MLTISERLRLVWMLATKSNAQLVADRIRQIPADEITRMGEDIVRNTQAVLVGVQAVQVGLLDEITRQTELLNEITARLTSVEQGQREATTDRAANLMAITVHLAAIDERLARGDRRFDELDGRLSAYHRPLTESERGE